MILPDMQLMDHIPLILAIAVQLGYEDFNNMEMRLGCFMHFIKHSEHADYVRVEDVSWDKIFWANMSCAAHRAIGTADTC
jgi:hypothetical protein